MTRSMDPLEGHFVGLIASGQGSTNHSIGFAESKNFRGSGPVVWLATSNPDIPVSDDHFKDILGDPISALSNYMKGEYEVIGSTVDLLKFFALFK